MHNRLIAHEIKKKKKNETLSISLILGTGSRLVNIKNHRRAFFPDLNRTKEIVINITGKRWIVRYTVYIYIFHRDSWH